MIFKTVNQTINKTAYDINIKNIDLAAYHWGSERHIADYLDQIENMLPDKDNFNKNIVLHAIKLLKENHRVLDMKFYRVPDENKLILLTTTDVGKFKDPETFTREMSITFKHDKFSFSVIEILKKEGEEIKAGTKAIPANWVLDEALTSRWAKLKEYAF